MIQHILSEKADLAGLRYRMLTDSWRSLYSSAFGATNFGSSALVVSTLKQAYAIAEQFMVQERIEAERVINDFAKEAQQTTLREITSKQTEELSDAAREHLSASLDYVVDELSAQIYRDIALLRQSLQHAYLEVSIASKSRRLSGRSALFEYTIGNKTNLQFMFIDRNQRRWESKRFVRGLWRHALLSVYNEMVLMTLADHGIDRARVNQLNADADTHGLVIAFASNTDLPTYSEIRNEVFHPNSNAVLGMENAHVSA